MIQKVTLVISILALALSLAMWIYTLITHRKKVDIKILMYRHHEKCPLFYVLFENKSRLPISFTRIALVTPNGKYLDCMPVSERVFTRVSRKKGEVIDRRHFYSLPLPISLDSLGGLGGFVYFESDQLLFPTPPKSVTFLIHTNRGKKGVIRCQCPDPYTPESHSA